MAAGEISGRAFLDEGRDGSWDGSDTALGGRFEFAPQEVPGETVQVVAELRSAGALVARQPLDAAGGYAFSGLAPGDYTVTFGYESESGQAGSLVYLTDYQMALFDPDLAPAGTVPPPGALVVTDGAVVTWADGLGYQHSWTYSAASYAKRMVAGFHTPVFLGRGGDLSLAGTPVTYTVTRRDGTRSTVPRAAQSNAGSLRVGPLAGKPGGQPTLRALGQADPASGDNLNGISVTVVAGTRTGSVNVGLAQLILGPK